MWGDRAPYWRCLVDSQAMPAPHAPGWLHPHDSQERSTRRRPSRQKDCKHSPTVATSAWTAPGVHIWTTASSFVPGVQNLLVRVGPLPERQRLCKGGWTADDRGGKAWSVMGAGSS